MRRHHFTIDVEEYFHVAAFAPWVLPADWTRWPSRVARCVSRLLTLLAEHQARATFFVLGWVAQQHPDIVRAIAAAGLGFRLTRVCMLACCGLRVRAVPAFSWFCRLGLRRC